jgi:large subunit ribosomal protein L3
MTAEKAATKAHIKLMGKKCGMTQVFNAKGALVPCTVIHAEPNVITMLKTKQNDGYEAVQLAFDEIRVKDARTLKKRCTKPRLGLFQKAQVPAARHLMESRVSDSSQFTVGQSFNVTFFQDVTYVDVAGVSKGKGFQGVMKLHNMRGGPASHGSGFHRHAGSTGMRTSPGRCLPGGPRASHMGDDHMTVQNLKVIAIDEVNNLIMVEGATPGAKGSLLVISEAKKKQKNQNKKS